MMTEPIRDYMEEHRTPLTGKILERDREIRTELMKICLEESFGDVNAIPNHLKMIIPFSDPDVRIKLWFHDFGYTLISYEGSELQQFINPSIPVAHIRLNPAGANGTEYTLECLSNDMNAEQIRKVKQLLGERTLLGLLQKPFYSYSRIPTKGNMVHSFFLRDDGRYNFAECDDIRQTILKYIPEVSDFYESLIRDMRTLAEEAVRECTADLVKAFDEIFTYLAKKKEEDMSGETEGKNDSAPENREEKEAEPEKTETSETVSSVKQETAETNGERPVKGKKKKMDEDAEQLTLF